MIRQRRWRRSLSLPDWSGSRRCRMPPGSYEWYGARRQPSDRPAPQTAPADRLKSLCGKAPTDAHKHRSNEHRPLRKPAAALFAPDGLRFYRVIAGQWVPKLTPGGLCAVEVGCGQAAAVAAILDWSGSRRCRTPPESGTFPREAARISGRLAVGITAWGFSLRSGRENRSERTAPDGLSASHPASGALKQGLASTAPPLGRKIANKRSISS